MSGTKVQIKYKGRKIFFEDLTSTLVVRNIILNVFCEEKAKIEIFYLSCIRNSSMVKNVISSELERLKYGNQRS